MLETWIPLLVLGAIVGVWLDALTARELATRHCREICQQGGVQLLDQTVSLRRLTLVRRSGPFALRRSYGFEVSTDGHDRHRGQLSLVGGRLETWSLPLAVPSHALPVAGDRFH